MNPTAQDGAKALRGLMALFVAGTLSCDAGTVGPTPEPGGPDLTAIDRLFSPWDSPDTPGCGLAIAEAGELLYSRGYGSANLDDRTAITPQTVFDVASVNKQFVAGLLSMLALEGTLSLDDDVRQWLPELPEYEAPITLRKMIHHTSGLRDYLNLFPLAGRDDYYPISHDQILAMMSRQRALVFPPGERFRYSNTAYMLLAQVIERASGRSLGQLAEERIFRPLGMRGSRMYDDRQAIIPHRAIGYGRDDEGRLRVTQNDNFDVAGDGQLYTTMEDLLRWDDYLHGTEQPPIHSLMMTEGLLADGESTGYAQGLRLGEYRGLRTIGHSGSSWGFRTQLLRFVEPALSIAISCNADESEPWDIAYRVATHYLADQLEPLTDETESEEEVPAGSPPEPLTLSAEELAAFAGTYVSPELDATYRFERLDGGLVVRIEQQPSIVVVPVAEDRFEFLFHPAGWSGPEVVHLTFERDRDGAVRGFGLSSSSERDLRFERRDPW